MMNWIPVGSLADIPPRGARCVSTPHGRIGIFRTADDRVFALEDHCPHRGGPLSQGIVHGAAVTCPLHNWVISLETGKALGADEGVVRTVPVKVEGERLFIALDALVAKAASGWRTRAW
jgi:nitrite reductase (NADH) small subunit